MMILRIVLVLVLVVFVFVLFLLGGGGVSLVQKQRNSERTGSKFFSWLHVCCFLYGLFCDRTSITIEY